MRFDVPEPGMISFHVSSLPPNPDVYPLLAGRIRAKVEIIGFIFMPKIDPLTGAEYCDVFMTNCTDINGAVPKWL
jgi:hypothetical protein